MKKSELRNIIRESIKELREDIDPGPHNSHRRLVGTVCESNTGLPVVGPNNIITITQNTGTQCNGQICTQSDIGQTFTWHYSYNGSPNSNNYFTFVLNSFNTSMYSNDPRLVISSNCSNPLHLTSFDCKGGIKKQKCVKVQGPGGQFATKQECIESGCEGIGPNKGPSTTPFIIDPQIIDPQDPQSKMTDPEIDRMQKIANIKKR